MLTLTIAITFIALTLITAANAASPAEKVARAVTATWGCQDRIGVPRTKTGNIWAKHSPGYRRHQLRTWQQRLETCRQQNWQAWLPDKWRRVGICETGLNWRHANSSYVSAFGIQAGSHNGAYDNDAARVGMPPWASGPSPWAQYQTALSHYNRFGGFSGWGCRGA